jgi:TATA-binding protein-associated factor Taf7
MSVIMILKKCVKSGGQFNVDKITLKNGKVIVGNKNSLDILKDNLPLDLYDEKQEFDSEKEKTDDETEEEDETDDETDEERATSVEDILEEIDEDEGEDLEDISKFQNALMDCLLVSSKKILKRLDNFKSI